MGTREKNKCFIYKNDLKFNENLNLEESEFESDAVRSIYKNFKNKPKIELRIEDSKMENYRYLDLSKLEVDDEYLLKLFELNKIVNILKRIEFLDLANNNLTKMPDLSKYPNIKYLSVSFNNIEQNIIDDNLVELSCHNNKIKSIVSNKLTHLNASNNQIISIDVPKIRVMVISFNKLKFIPSYLDLKYLECIQNQIINIDNMLELEELYIGNNNLISIKNMPKLKVLNCVNNPIVKINYFPKLKTLMASIAKVSSQYVVTNISKIKLEFLINFNPDN
jgi:hypothetical protein